MRDDYTYFADGRLKQFHDLDDTTAVQGQWHYMSRSYSYDQAARIAGVGALDPNTNNTQPPPFSASYGYDPFSNMTSRAGSYGVHTWQGDGSPYTNNRRNGWNYDFDGRVTASADANTSSSRTWSYDAAGEKTSVAETAGGATTTDTMSYDGDGQLVYESVANPSFGTSDYLIHSTVLGGAVLTKLDSSGAKSVTYVPAKGLIAPMQQTDGNNNPSISWVHRDPLGVQEGSGAAYDPLGNLINNEQPPISGPPPSTPFYGPSYSGVSWSTFINANNFSTGCMLDGAPADCGLVLGSRSVNIEHVNNPGAPGESIVTTGHSTWVPGQDSALVHLNGINNSSVDIYDGEGHFESTGSESEIDTIVNLQPGNDWMNNNPGSIGNDTKFCSITVSFQGSNPQFKNGPGERNINTVPRGYGVGFTVTGSVRYGEIGKVETGPDGKMETVNPGGAWTIQQYVSESRQVTYEKAGDHVFYPHTSTSPDGPTDMFRQINGNRFTYFDFPGPITEIEPVLGRLTYFRGEYDFAAKVINGTEQCEVKFHISMTLQGGAFAAHWGSR